MTRVDHFGPMGWGREPPRHLLYPREEVALAFLEPEIRHASRLLDVGCGDGAFLAVLARRHAHLALSGVDMSATQVDRARAAVPQVDIRLTVADVELPFADASFDFVYSGEVLEHVYNPDAFIGECARVLAPDGTLVISTPNLAAWYNRVLLLLGQQPLLYETSTVSTAVGAGITRRFRLGSVPVGHVRLFTTGALRDLVEMHGLEFVSRCGAPFHSLSGITARLDTLLSCLPSLASIHLVKARR